jgi:hypothetical protein
MKRTIGILLLLAGIALGVYGFTTYDRNTADVKIGDLEISAGDEGGQQQSYTMFILAGIGVIAGVALMTGGSKRTAM